MRADWPGDNVPSEVDGDEENSALGALGLKTMHTGRD